MKAVMEELRNKNILRHIAKKKKKKKKNRKKKKKKKTNERIEGRNRVL